MSGSVFRSTLMQQFVASARNQHRPPLALAGLSGSARTKNSTHNDDTSLQPQQRHVSAPTHHSYSVSNSHQSMISQQSQPCEQRYKTTSLDSEYHCNIDDSTIADNSDNSFGTSPPVSIISSTLNMTQNLIQTRRPISNFMPPPTNNTNNLIQNMFVKDAIQRAVACGGLHHHRHPTRRQLTTFKRIMSPSTVSERLASIAYNVKLRKNPDSRHNMLLAERRRNKWNSIPAFLVALVVAEGSNQSIQQQQGSNDRLAEHQTSDGDDMYEPLPFNGPQSDRQLEGYASSCASIQNILLSLHSEGLGTKWTAGGDIIRTKAFRSLIQAKDDEAVVGLIMVGYPFSEKQPTPPKHNLNEVLQDL